MFVCVFDGPQCQWVLGAIFLVLVFLALGDDLSFSP